MKIVLAAHHYPPQRMGGVELITQRTAEWLARHGHNVDVVCVETISESQGSKIVAQKEQMNGVGVHRLELGLNNNAYPLELIYENEELGKWFEALLHRINPDLVDIRSCYLLSASIISAAKRVALPLLLSLHDYWFLCPRMTLLRSDGERCPGAREAVDCAWCFLAASRRYRLPDKLVRGQFSQLVRGSMDRGSSLAKKLRWDNKLAVMQHRRVFLRKSLDMVDHVSVQSPFLKDKLVAEGIPANKIHIITCGLDLGKWQSPKKHPVECGALRVGYLGQLVPKKGAHLLIRAFHKLHVSDTMPRLQIYGDLSQIPAYGRELRRLARGNDRIVFSGKYENADVAEILAKLDVIVVPSQWYETGPLVTLEAFATRTPVVATDLPNMNSQVTHELDGLLFKPNDVQDLARQLQRILDEPSLLRRLAANIGPVKTSEEEIVETMQLYRTLLATLEETHDPAAQDFDK